ncbi:MAG TPA: APC family permease [Vicinamibacterales bacterium]|nr:APC family permease [Vicinamibacterales bacterium]
MTRPDQTTFIKALGLWDVVAMNIVAVVGLRWIARSARVGAPSVSLWVLACVLFFIPLALALIELSSRHPEQGGIYAWVRRAFGPLHGFIVGWCLWVNNLFYFPSLLLFAAANFALVVSPADLADDRLYSVVFVLGLLWFCTAVNIIGLQAGKWVQNIGSLATWIPPILLIACGAIAFATFGSATSFAPSELVPQYDLLTTMSLWSSMCFAFSGFEIASMVGQEVKDPRRNIPRGIIIAGFMVTGIYILSSSSVLVAVPASELAERSGIADAVDLTTGRLGLAGMGALTGMLLVVGAIGGTNSWVAGAARVPFAAGVDSVLPSAFGRLHTRYRTPHVALLIQGLAASLLFLASVFISIGGEQTSIQESYDILVNLTILIYFVPYLYLFAAWIWLRHTEPATSGEDVMTMARGMSSVWLIAGCGFVATFIAIGLVFVPPPGTESVFNYQANLIGQALVLFAIGFVFYVTARRRARFAG